MNKYFAMAAAAVLGLSGMAMAANIVDGPLPIKVSVAQVAELHLDLTPVELTIQQAGPIKQGVDNSQIARRDLTIVCNTTATVSASLTGNLPKDSVFWIVLNPTAGWTKLQNQTALTYFEWNADGSGNISGPTSGINSFTQPAGVSTVPVDYAVQVGGSLPNVTTTPIDAVVTWTIAG